MSSAAVVIGVLRAYKITGNLNSLVVHAAMHPNKTEENKAPIRLLTLLAM